MPSWPLFCFEQKQDIIIYILHACVAQWYDWSQPAIIKLFKSAHQKFFWKDKLLKVKHYSICCCCCSMRENFISGLNFCSSRKRRNTKHKTTPFSFFFNLIRWQKWSFSAGIYIWDELPHAVHMCILALRSIFWSTVKAA